MNKSRIKNYLKLVMLVFSITLLTTNCEKTEDSLKEEPISKPRFSIEFIPYETFSKNSKLFQKIQKLDKSTNLNKSSRSVYNENYGFTIDLDDSKYLESNNGNYHSYTFTITRDEPIDLLENLVVSLQPDGSYKTLITAYHLLDFNTFGVAYQEIDFNTDTVFSKTSQSRNCITWTTCEIWDYFCTDCESESPEWTYSCGAYSTHEACDFIDAGDSSTGGGTSSNPSAPFINNGSQWDNTFWSTGSGGETSNTGNDPNTDNPPDNNEPCIQDANGNCIGDATSPKIKETEPETVDEKNCEELQKLLGIPNYPITPPLKSPKQAILHLKSLISSNIDSNNDQERGYNLLHNSNLEASASWVTNTSSRSVRYRFAVNNYGGCHLHPNDGKGHPFFSPEDILNLWRFSSTYNNGSTVDPSLFVHIMVSTKGVYAIKIDNPIIFSQLGAIYNDYRDANGDGTYEVEDFSRPLKNAYEKFVDSNSGIPNGSDSQYQRAFLKFMKNFNGNGSNLGISLYKADNSLTSWSKLTLNEDTEIITPTPCN